MINTFRLVLFLEGFRIQKAQKEVDKCHALSRADFVAWQEKMCRDILRFHFEKNASYREFLGGMLPEKWQDVPEMTKNRFQKPLEELLSEGYTKKNVYVSNTSGSTGKPFFFAKDKFSHAVSWAVIFYYQQLVGLKSNDLQARFYGIPVFGKSKKLEDLKDRVMNRIRFPVFALNSDSLDKYIEVFKSRQVKYIYGYTNSIRHFSAYLLSKSICLKDICPTLKLVIVTSEMCTPSDKLLIEKATGMPVFIEYGASEIGVIAFSDQQGNLRVCEESLYIEVNDRNEILLTTFYNKAFPIIRYKVGDMGKIERTETGTYIRSLMGRSDDHIILPNGQEAAGMTFYYCSREILERSLGIQEIYFTQKTRETFLINYIADADLDATGKASVAEVISKMLQPGLSLIFERTDEIRRKKNGKFQIFTSEIN